MGEADRAAVHAGDYFGTAGFYYGQHTLPLPDTEPIGDGYIERYGDIEIEVIETPGHTLGSVTYKWRRRRQFGKVARAAISFQPWLVLSKAFCPKRRKRGCLRILLNNSIIGAYFMELL
jgi:hypothetical protein